METKRCTAVNPDYPEIQCSLDAGHVGVIYGTGESVVRGTNEYDHCNREMGAYWNVTPVLVDKNKEARNEARLEARQLAAFAIEDAARHAELDKLVRNELDRIVENLETDPSKCNLYLVTAKSRMLVREHFVAIIGEENALGAIKLLQNYNAFNEGRTYPADEYDYRSTIVSLEGMSDLYIPAGVFMFVPN